MSIKKYIAELKRRHVFKAGIAYLIVAWVVAEVASLALTTFEAPPYIMKTLVFLLGIGFLLNLVFSWIYDITPDGIQKTETLGQNPAKYKLKSGRLNKVIIASLSLAVLILLYNQIWNVTKVEVIEFGETVTTGNKSIAVLAFTDMSPKKDQEYFSDGISEELLNLLSKLPELRVISRTSSFSYKGKNTTAEDIGKELKVSHILEGSIRKAGNTLRITAKLINTKDGSQIWSETYDRDLNDIFKIQDEIAGVVTSQLQLTLLGAKTINKNIDTEAYTLYLEANYLVHQNTKKAYLSAEELVKKSIEIEPNYAPAWGLLASIYNTGVYNFSIREYEEGISLGLEAAMKAIKLDPDSGEGYATLSSLQELDWDFDQSAKNMDKALELDPNNAIIIGTAANMVYGDIQKSIDLLHKAISLDPLVYVNYYNLGFAHYKVNEIDKAEEAFQTFAMEYPNAQILHYMMAMVRLAQGRFDEALIEIEQESHEFFGLYGKNFVFYALGKQEQADALFEEFIEKHSKTDPANLADLYAFRGDIDQSFYWLNRAVEIKDPVLLEALAYPSLKILHKDPRWNTLINNMGLPEDHGYPTN